MQWKWQIHLLARKCWFSNVVHINLLRYHALFSTILFPSLNRVSKWPTDYSSYSLAFGWTIGIFFPFLLAGPAGCPCWKHFNSQTPSKEECRLLDVWLCPSVGWAVQFLCTPTPCYSFLFQISYLCLNTTIVLMSYWVGLAILVFPIDLWEKIWKSGFSIVNKYFK